MRTPYSPLLLEHFQHPRNVGSLPADAANTGTAVVGTLEQGHLLQWQLRVAAGQPLPKRQDELRIIGHAIEARICAENPDNSFLPATGTLHVYRKPESTSFGRGAVRARFCM